MGVTSGNSYAIALAIQAIERAQRETGRAPEESVLVIAGAAGNIGRTCATLLAARYRRTVLIGSSRPGSARRLRAIAEQVPRAQASTDLAAAAEGHVVVVALNAVDAPLGPRHFAREAVVCDLSVPAAVQASTAEARSDLRLLQGGIVALPFGEDLRIVGFPLPSGQTYACMAEAILLGFEGIADTTFTGLLTAEHVTRVAALAARHEFALAEYKRCSVLSRPRKEDVYASRG
jgi:predicted amino acid dehydrogenase